MKSYSCRVCGLITPERYCPEHKPKDTGSRGGSTRSWRRLRLRVFRRDRWKCQLCGFVDRTRTGAGLHCDHIRPRSKGGSDELSNLRTLCSGCNLSKGAREA
jgi:5-methylcytosine-specific restriction protein A